MPTLTFTEGDTAEIIVHNQLKESTSLHWHGLYLPNKEDGVPLFNSNADRTRRDFYLSISLLFNQGHIGIIVIVDCKSKSVCMAL
jgi:FtsP/CotA-like multicopper oxidase with cupredoxin domain